MKQALIQQDLLHHTPGGVEGNGVTEITAVLRRQMDADIKRLVEAPPNPRNHKPREDDEASGGSSARMAQGVAAWHKGSRGWLLRRMAMQRSDPAWRCALTAAGGEFAALSRIPDGVADDLARLGV